MSLLAHLAALLAILGTGVVHGTDVFCALVQHPHSPGSTTPLSPP